MVLTRAKRGRGVENRPSPRPPDVKQIKRGRPSKPRAVKSSIVSATHGGSSKLLKSYPVVENMYDTLDDDDSGDDLPARKRLTKSKNEVVNSQAEPTNADKKSVTTAPIVVDSVDIGAMQSLLKDIVKSSKFEIKLMKSGIRISIPNPDEHKCVTERFKTENMGYYLYHTSNTRPQKYVLYGLHDMECTELKNKPEFANVKPTDVRKFTLRQKTFASQAIYVFYFEPKSISLAILKQIKAVDNIVVRWDRFQPRRNDNVPQCYNCQRLGHSSVNCQMPPSCVVCAKKHSSDECPNRLSRSLLKTLSQDNMDRSYVKCANCNQQHTASYRGCEKRKEFLKVHEKIIQKNRKSSPGFQMRNSDFPDINDKIPRQAVANQRPIVSYRDIAEGGPFHVPQQQASISPDMSGLMNSMQQMITMMTAMMSKLFEVIDLLTRQAQRDNNGGHK